MKNLRKLKSMLWCRTWFSVFMTQWASKSQYKYLMCCLIRLNAWAHRSTEVPQSFLQVPTIYHTCYRLTHPSHHFSLPLVYFLCHGLLHHVSNYLSMSFLSYFMFLFHSVASIPYPHYFVLLTVHNFNTTCSYWSFTMTCSDMIDKHCRLCIIHLTDNFTKIPWFFYAKW